MNREEDPENKHGMDRRGFLRLAGASSVFLATRLPVMAGPFETTDFTQLIPADKKLHPDWVKSLFARGTPEVWRDDELSKIGMPVGGIGAGQIYLGGDGRLWHWDIFNEVANSGGGGPHYAEPLKPSSPLEQGFALQIGGQTHALDRNGFSEVTFRGEYPIGVVEYKDAALPVTVRLEAFSPFIPLATDDSSLPATIMQFTVRNTSSAAVEAMVIGRLENAVCLNNRLQFGTRRNRIHRGSDGTFLECSAERNPGAAARPDVVFEDWSKETYEGWTVEGAAFGSGPVKRPAMPAYQGDVGGDTEQVANSHASAPGADVAAKDNATGKLTSRRFMIERNFINFWIGGGHRKGEAALNLVVNGKTALSETGRDSNRMIQRSFDVRGLRGKEAFIEIVDAATGGWGNIGVGKISFSDRPANLGVLEELPDFGTLGLALPGAPAEHASADETATLGQTLVGELGRKLQLEPGQSATVIFVLTWHFPNLELNRLGKVGRHYASRFGSALAVARYVAQHQGRLIAQTRLWRDTWHDSTLPCWFLDRTLLNTCILATSTCFRLWDGRFYAWEGVGCCEGTCAHVWHYAHAPARLFPALERDTRERVDFGLAFDPATGVIGFRAEFDRQLAVDAQAGTILRAYREHQMSADDSFLRRNWPRIKKAFDPLFKLDGNDDGVLEGPQMNTLDQPWFGKVAWLSSLYLAALRAGEAMGREAGDNEFARKAAAIAEAGGRNLDEKLFNGEYYIQVHDPAHVKSVGSYEGCEIDQVFGQSWAFQVGLGRVLPEAHVKSALASLWKYNFTPDVGPFRKANKPGRWYAMAGEGGLIMCGWPRGSASRVQQGFDSYFNECMTGFEYQAAGHMIWEGMALEGLAVARAIHDRYHPLRRNPWNEIECGDHYARAMASYGLFTAACGFEYHGPKGHIGFAPRLTPENFKAAFTSAEGWGAFSQKLDAQGAKFEIALKHGRLRLKTIALAVNDQMKSAQISVSAAGKSVPATMAREGNRLMVTLGEEAVIEAGQGIEVAMA